MTATAPFDELVAGPAPEGERPAAHRGSRPALPVVTFIAGSALLGVVLAAPVCLAIGWGSLLLP